MPPAVRARDTLGALDLSAHAESAFTDDSEHVGRLVASDAAIAAADAHHFANGPEPW